MHGVVHQYSCVETPQQNSVVKRKHQRLLNVAHALFFQSRVAIQFWSDCVLTAAYLINRTPSWLLGNKAPLEILHKQLIDYSHLKVFGCLAFASTLSVERTKFDPRARICVFLSYPPDMKGHKLYDLLSKQVLISHNVVFHEHIFPFHSVIATTDLIDPFPGIVLPSPTPDIPSHSSSPISSHPTSIIPSTSPPISSQQPAVPIRKSTQSTRLPFYLKDFHCHLSTHYNNNHLSHPDTLYPISYYLSCNSISPSNKAFIMAVSSSFEPQFYHQAVPF